MDRDPALRRFVFVSSMAATGPGPDASPLVEETEPHPISPYGESKLWAERALCRLADGGPLTIVRPPGVFGPRDRDVYRYFQLVARGIVPVLGWQNTASVAYVKNLVHGMRLAAESALPGTRTYFLADDGLFTWPGFAELIAQALGRRSFRVPVPRLVVSAIAAVGDLVAAISGRPALLGHQKVTELSQPNWVVSDARAREELGYRPLFTTEQGVAETVAWYVSKGWL
jgi:nucleoside-diphosphate-sugar epimerase